MASTNRFASSYVRAAVALVVLSQQVLAATTYTYDPPLSRLTRIDYGNGQVVQYTYDPFSRALHAFSTVTSRW